MTSICCRNILFLVKISLVPNVGEITLNKFFEKLFHKNFLRKCSFGKPDILKINFVLKKITKKNW